jgi:hypothetical protein
MARDRRGLLLLLLAGLAAATGACERPDDSIHAALAAKTAGWQRELRSLSDQRGALAQRLPGSGREAAADRRLRATLNGFQQSVADVDGQMRQIAPRVDEVLKRRPQEARAALEKETALMDSYLRGLAADLTSARQQIDLLATNDRNDKGGAE